MFFYKCFAKIFGLNFHKIFVGFLVFIFCGILLGLADTAWAASSDTEEILRSLGTLLSVVIRFITFIILLIVSWGGELFGTEFLTSEKALEGIRPMWMFIRNITNVGFVLVLLYIAFANLFTFGDGGWGIKQKLPGVIIGLVAVNFSLLGFRVVIDAVNVGTIAVLSIADKAVEEKGTPNVKDLLEHKIDDSGASCGEDGNGTGKNCQAFYEWINKSVCSGGIHDDECFFEIKTENLTKETPTTRNLMLSFAVHFMHIEKLPVLAGETGSITNLIDSTLFSFVMALAYAVVIIAVFLVLVYRMIVLWVAMVFSPLIIASMILGMNIASGSTGQFVNTLLVPLKVAAAFAISFVMTAVLIDYVPSSALNFMEPGTALKHFQNVEGSNMFSMLWKFATLVVFWQAATWAIKDSHGAEIGQKVMDGAKGAGTFLAKAATVDREIFRLPGMDEKVSATTLGQVPGMISQARTAHLQKDRKEFLEDADKLGLGWLGGGGNDAMRDFTDNLETLSGETSKTGHQIAESLKGLDGWSNDSELTAQQRKHLSSIFSRFHDKENVDRIINDVSSAKKNKNYDALGSALGEGTKTSDKVFKRGWTPTASSTTPTSPKDRSDETDSISGSSDSDDVFARKKVKDNAKILSTANKNDTIRILKIDAGIQKDDLDSGADLDKFAQDLVDTISETLKDGPDKVKNEANLKSTIKEALEAIKADADKTEEAEAS